MPITLSLLCTQLTKQTFLMYPDMREKISKSNIWKNAIISDVLMSHDVEFETKSFREMGMDVDSEYYVEEAEDSKYEYLRNLITIVCNNNGVKEYDTNFSTEKKKQIFINSINNHKERFLAILNKEDYETLNHPKIKSTLLSEHHRDILHYLEDKTSDEKKMRKILDLIEKTNNNFIFKDENDRLIYPVISDLIFDTFNLDYYSKNDSDFIANLRIDFSATKKYQQKGLQKLPKVLYDKATFIENIKEYKSRNYILKEYARTLNCDIDLFKKLYLEILYYNTQGSRALRSKLDITDIYPREFILCLTKIIIPLKEPLLTIDAI